MDYAPRTARARRRAVSASGDGLTRRRLLAGAGAAGAGVGLGVGGYLAGHDAAPDASAAVAQPIVPFYGPHQAGIATAAQERLHFAAFDFTGGRDVELRDLLYAWTVAAARMTAGMPIG